MTTPSTATGVNKYSPAQIDIHTGAMALIDILFDMKAINKATYDSIKRYNQPERKVY